MAKTRIRAQCNRPKYANGVYEFQFFEELRNWLSTIEGLAKGDAGSWHYSLAKDGRTGPFSKPRADLEITCSSHDYSLSRDVAFTTGLLRTRGVSEKLSKNPEIALAFARAWDSSSLVTST